MRQVRRGIQTCAEPGRAQRRLRERAGGPLAVGASDMQRGRPTLRLSEQRARLAHPRKAQLHAEVAAREEQLLELREVHSRSSPRSNAALPRGQCLEAGGGGRCGGRPGPPHKRRRAAPERPQKKHAYPGRSSRMSEEDRGVDGEGAAVVVAVAFDALEAGLAQHRAECGRWRARRPAAPRSSAAPARARRRVPPTRRRFRARCCARARRGGRSPEAAPCSSGAPRAALPALRRPCRNLLN